MKVILVEKVPTLGNVGEIVNVSQGYGRNFLIPNKKAVLADDAHKSELENSKKRLKKKMDEEIAEFQRQKLAREEAKAREVQRIKEQKEKEVQRLRDMQERANDRAAEMDQIRAQKAYEKAELENRAVEAAKKRKHDAALADLHVSRQKQF